MILFRSITPTVPLVMLEAVKLMAAVCLVPPDGHDKVGVRRYSLSFNANSDASNLLLLIYKEEASDR